MDLDGGDPQLMAGPDLLPAAAAVTASWVLDLRFLTIASLLSSTGE